MAAALNEIETAQLEQCHEINITKEGYFSNKPTGMKIFASLPDEPDDILKEAYQYREVETAVERPQRKIENGEYVKDEDGVYVMETVLVGRKRMGWALDEARQVELQADYDKLMKRKSIMDLKQQLTDSDYKVIKCYECSLVSKEMPYDIETLHMERQEIRDRINELELQLEDEDA